MKSPFPIVVVVTLLPGSLYVDQSQLETLVTVVREAVAHSGVIEVRDHFAITVNVNPRTSERDIERLTDKVADALSLHRLPFKWVVMFVRTRKQVEVLTPDE